MLHFIFFIIYFTGSQPKVPSTPAKTGSSCETFTYPTLLGSGHGYIDLLSTNSQPLAGSLCTHDA